MRKQKKLGVIKAKIKRGDEVVFIAGKEFNRYQKVGEKVERVPLTGKVIAVDPTARKVKVDGAMIVKKHRKPNPQMNIKGGIIKQEAWVDISNIALVDPKTGKPTRVKIEERDGQKVRVAKSGEIIPNPNPFARVETKETEEEAVEETTVDSAEEEATEENKEKPKKKEPKKDDKKSEEKSEDKSEEE